MRGVGTDEVGRFGRQVIQMLSLLIPLAAVGCGDGSSRVDEELVAAYTEVLIAEAMHPSDSLAWVEEVAPHLDGTRFSSPAEVQQAIRDLAIEDARAFTATMDSVQQRLDRIRSGNDESREETPADLSS